LTGQLYKLLSTTIDIIEQCCWTCFLCWKCFLFRTHTQWPKWQGDDRKDWILRCCKFYMSYGTLSFFYFIVEKILH